MLACRVTKLSMIKINSYILVTQQLCNLLRCQVNGAPQSALQNCKYLSKHLRVGHKNHTIFKLFTILLIVINFWHISCNIFQNLNGSPFLTQSN